MKRTYLDNVAHQEPHPNVGVPVQIVLDQAIVDQGFHNVRTTLGELASDEALHHLFSIVQDLVRGWR